MHLQERDANIEKEIPEGATWEFGLLIHGILSRFLFRFHSVTLKKKSRTHQASRRSKTVHYVCKTNQPSPSYEYLPY